MNANNFVGKNDPNRQQHHTFGSSPAAERLKREIDSGIKGGSGIIILTKAQARANQVANSNLPDKKYFLFLLRREVLTHISESTSPEIVKSLCRNIFSAKIKALTK